ncbi:MAG: sulfatase-like hydrolase/transferase [Bacteroidetes bacterium]|nr:sulfatase-like hydrolase/transferase [Bacteroidota bacterium]
MKRFKIWTILFAVILLCSNPAAARETGKPNIIFILADDLIFDGIGAYGRSDMKTPNLDRIADKGFRFTRFYNTTAICMASRAQYMTGLYEFSTGCNFDRDNLAHELWEQSYPFLLKQSGYTTGFAGKFGFRVDEPGGKGSVETVKRSFDWWCGWLGQGKYDMAGNSEAEEYIKLHGSRSEHTTHALGEMGKAFIKKYADKKKPFCLSISFKAPHTPYHTDPRYDSTYASWEFHKPENYGEVETLPPHVKAGRPYSKGKSWLKDYQTSMRNYHQMVYGMDAAVGSIISELEKQQIHENTVIIFTSDNGHFNGVKGFSGKLHPYEEGSLAPLLYFDPRARNQENSVVTALSGNIDIAPTILELAGADIPEKMVGRSLLPLLSGEATSIHPSLLLINAWGARAAQSVAVVTEQWKYIHWFYGAEGYQQQEELYHMGRDRMELSNEAVNPDFHGDLENMQNLYDGWMDHWQRHHRPGSDYGVYTELAGRGSDYSLVSDSALLLMGPGLTESDRKKAGKKHKQPNILFIMADDHASNAVGAYESHLKDVVQTPNIDRLAKEGALLTNVVCTNSLCTPSRASILTGLYSHKSGVYTLREELNSTGIPTLPKLFSSHGYKTAVVGKWHIHGDNLHGFDHYAVTRSQGAYINPSFDTREGKIRREGHSTDIITDLSIEWLREREKGGPFMLFTHYKAAHSPWQYAERHKELFAADSIPEPPTLFDSYENRAPGGVENNQARIHAQKSKMSLSYWFETNKKGKEGAWPTGQLQLEGKSDQEQARATYQKYVKDYMRCVKGIDEGVGRIIAYLEQTGELDNTVIIYTSDQGMYVGEHNFFDKRLGLEEAMKMPFLIRYPGEIESGMVVDQLVNNVDYPSTLLDFANIKIPEEMQGFSFREVLRGKEPENPRLASFYAFYSNGSPKHYGIRTKEYKLLKYVDKEGEVMGADLFNLSEDPRELVSLYGNPVHSILQEKMEKRLASELLNVDIAPGQLPGKLQKQ